MPKRDGGATVDPTFGAHPRRAVVTAVSERPRARRRLSQTSLLCAIRLIILPFVGRRKVDEALPYYTYAEGGRARDRKLWKRTCN